MQETVEEKQQTAPEAGPAPPENGRSVLVEPDLEFITALSKRGGDLFKKCMQCGTCSATCSISPDTKPFPSKEMAWASWGMKEQLLRDTDVWLCFHCNDCSTRCPRGARPGDVLAAVRQESVAFHAFPNFMGRWVNQPQFLPFLLSIPVILLTIAMYLKDPIESRLGITAFTGDRILFNYSNFFPDWLLNTFFFSITAIMILILAVGVNRFWKELKASSGPGINGSPDKSIIASTIAALKKIIAHKNFDKCNTMRTRYISHMFVFFGFIALSFVTFWVITAKINPLITRDFVYPFSFWNPWKMLANIGGLAVLTGLGLMMLDRFRDQEHTATGSYFDWTLIWSVFLVTLTGFITEILHYVRLEPHRHIAYFSHLVLVCGLILYLPYSKLAHIVYRTVAMIYAEYSGRASDKINKSD